MDYEHIIVERKEHLLIVRLNRPEVLNALHPYIFKKVSELSFKSLDFFK